jgi:hypothetical protein
MKVTIHVKLPGKVFFSKHSVIAVHEGNYPATVSDSFRL